MIVLFIFRYNVLNLCEFADTEGTMGSAATMMKSKAFRLAAGLVGIAVIGFVDRRLSETIPLVKMPVRLSDGSRASCRMRMLVSSLCSTSP